MPRFFLGLVLSKLSFYSSLFLVACLWLGHTSPSPTHSPNPLSIRAANAVLLLPKACEGHAIAKAPAGAEEGSLIWFSRSDYGQSAVRLPLGLGAAVLNLQLGLYRMDGLGAVGGVKLAMTTEAPPAWTREPALRTDTLSTASKGWVTIASQRSAVRRLLALANVSNMVVQLCSDLGLVLNSFFNDVGSNFYDAK